MKGGKSKADTVKTDIRLKSKGAGTGKRQSKKAAKDPNKPKRPASAFFVFMEDFRMQYAIEHPNNKAVSAVGKAGGQKWKSMSEAEKAPYVVKAEKRKTEYNKNMEAYNKKLVRGNGADEEESDKSNSEVNDEESGSWALGPDVVNSGATSCLDVLGWLLDDMEKLRVTCYRSVF
ncbi:hypothetical protein F2P56_019457 [Juglans regia]|uniref:HMG box domain-containing protein n=1 Tax=Juglans regia TaxID=51240 RepID=A0A834CLY9_JUGRE|nr:hypothetical protein F2P56_019457 [Juglans regia]